MANEWIKKVKDYHSKHPELSYKEVLIKLGNNKTKKNKGGSKFKLAVMPRNYRGGKGEYSMPSTTSTPSTNTSSNNDMVDLNAMLNNLDLSKIDFGQYDVPDNSMSSMNSMPSMPSFNTRTPRQEARDQRFMTRKVFNQLIKLKKKNDKNGLGYTMDQLKNFAINGVSI